MKGKCNCNLNEEYQSINIICCGEELVLRRREWRTALEEVTITPLPNLAAGFVFLAASLILMYILVIYSHDRLEQGHRL